MSGSRQGTTYLSDVVGSPILPASDHKTLFTRDDGVFVVNSAGIEVRLDDYQLIQSISGSLSSAISGQAVALWQGSKIVNIDESQVSISYTPEVALTDAYPVVSLIGPDANAVIYPLSVISRTVTGFDVIIGGAPDIAGYSIDWFLAAGGAAAAGAGGGGTPSAGTITVIGGATTVSDVTTLQIVGATVADGGGGTATVNISSGTGGSTGFSMTSTTGNAFTFNDTSSAYSCTLNGPATIYCPTNLQNGESKTIRIIQPSTVYSLSYENTSPFVWKFSNGSPPVITSSPNAIDILTMIRMDNDIYITIIKNFLEII